MFMFFIPKANVKRLDKLKRIFFLARWPVEKEVSFGQVIARD
jgi:hypothetical protein